MTAPGTPHHVNRPAVTWLAALTASQAARPDHAEQPHPPEAPEAIPLAGPETEVVDRHVLTLDHPVYGQLNGQNYLGYCDECPAAGPGLLCYGSCPEPRSDGHVRHRAGRT
jgi:hypothetical protein